MCSPDFSSILNRYIKISLAFIDQITSLSSFFGISVYLLFLQKGFLISF